MSLERLKKYSSKIALISKVLYIITLIFIIWETVIFMWQALMPNKLGGFFDTLKLYKPFVTNIDNNPLSLFELAGGIFKSLFLYLMLKTAHKIFSVLKEDLEIEKITRDIRILSSIFIAESLLVPLIKTICHYIFVGTHIPMGAFDLCPLVIGAFLYFIALFIDSTSVTKQ